MSDLKAVLLNDSLLWRLKGDKVRNPQYAVLIQNGVLVVPAGDHSREVRTLALERYIKAGGKVQVGTAATNSTQSKGFWKSLLK